MTFFLSCPGGCFCKASACVGLESRLVPSFFVPTNVAARHTPYPLLIFVPTVAAQHPTRPGPYGHSHTPLVICALTSRGRSHSNRPMFSNLCTRIAYNYSLFALLRGREEEIMSSRFPLSAFFSGFLFALCSLSPGIAGPSQPEISSSSRTHYSSTAGKLSPALPFHLPSPLRELSLFCYLHQLHCRLTSQQSYKKVRLDQSLFL